MAVPVYILPGINAVLNGLSALLLSVGWALIRAKKIPAHRLCMLSAFACSGVFLCSYLYYHYQVGSVRFRGIGPIRTVYFTILISHTTLAVLIVPMALRTLYLAWKLRFAEHYWWARRTLPLWLYVSVTGVVVYVMLYRL